MESCAGPGAAPVDWDVCTIVVPVVNLKGEQTVVAAQGRRGREVAKTREQFWRLLAGRRWKAGIHQLCLQLLFAPAQPSSFAHPWAACLGKEACAAAEGSACVRVDGGENHELCCTWLQTRGSEITRCEIALHQELRNRRSVAPVWRLNEVDSDGFCARGVLRLDTDGALPPPLS